MRKTMNEEIFNQNLIKHKKLISVLGNDYEDENLRIAVSMSGKELALAKAECKCQRCNVEEDLQVHHLILRYLEDYMDKSIFYSQRYYWANIVVLCKKCHKKLHNIPFNIEFNSECINKKKIEDIKEIYGIKDGKKNP